MPIMTGIPPQHDIMKYDIFHKPSPETSSSSRKRKQESQYPSMDTHLLNISFSQYPGIYAESFQYERQSEDLKASIVTSTSSSSTSSSFMQSSPASFDLPLEPLVTRTPQFQAFLPNDPEGSHNEGVGENNNLTDIMVDFDTLAQPNTFQRIVQRPNLQLTDLNVLHQRHQQQLIQSWDNTSSPMHSPSSRYSPGTPGFFTPGFLESLQEDEVYDHRIGIDWNTNTPPHPSNEAMEYNAMISPEKNLVAQSGEGVTFFTSSSPTDHALLGKEKTANRRACMGAPNNRMLQLSANAARIKPLVQTYLANSVSQEAATRLGEKTVIILTSKVAQKSYGTEKRFLCPPPTTILVGTGWWTAKDKVDSMGNEVLRVSGLDKDIILAPPKLTVSISGETSTQAGQIEWYTVSGATVGQTGQIKSTSSQGKENSSRFRSSESRHPPVDMYHNHQQEPLAAGKCVSKHLYINDADEKRKRVECLARLQLANGLQLGTLASKAIKVISKPSKKRQSVKNMELCIHHGTTVSLFNRIRSQTVSTKYLGVSTSEGTPLAFPGLSLQANTSSDGTCFVARTTSWDPFIVWIVDTSRSPGEPAEESDTPEDYIGPNVLSRSTPYPPPPAIALKNKTSQLIPIHYNQHIVLQCLTTGLVSPVMVIRKVDRASTVVGGARCTDDLTGGGGEFGDEVLGDPVSQLHKIALQIVQDPSSAQQQSLQDMMMPRTSQPVTYLACLNDMVGMHKTTEGRKPVTGSVTKPLNSQAWDESFSNDLFDITSQEGGKIIRKRRVSTDVQMARPPEKLMSSMSLSDHLPTSSELLRHQEFPHRRRVNSLNDELYYTSIPQHMFQQQPQSSLSEASRKSSISSNGSSSTTTTTTTTARRSSVASTTGNNLNNLGAYWSEDVSDAAVWTIVGTDCATYTFWSPSLDDPSSSLSTNSFPSLSHFFTSTNKSDQERFLTMHGENFSRDLQVWFGDVKAAQTEYRSRELIICKVPSRQELLETKELYGNIPILLVRGDSTICKTGKYYPL